MYHRRNPDAELRMLEHKYNETDDRRLWLKLQYARMRRGLDYERTFLERRMISIDPDDYELSFLVSPNNFRHLLEPDACGHGDTLIRSLLNNGWYVDTWWDDTDPNPDWWMTKSEPEPIGWTTIVYAHSHDAYDQIGGAVHCQDNTDCAVRCHLNKVDDIINGTIEDIETLPLFDEPPILVQRD